MEKEKRSQNRSQGRKIIMNFIIKMVLLALSLMGLWHFAINCTLISGEAMYPRLRDGDIAVVNRLPQTYYAGDVLLCKKSGDLCVGRIVAGAGDEVSITDQGGLYVNQALQAEEIFFETLPVNEKEIQLTVPPDSFYLLSDHRPEGNDSRVYGCVRKDEVIGKIFLVIRRRGI